MVMGFRETAWLPSLCGPPVGCKYPEKAGQDACGWKLFKSDGAH